MSKDRDYPSPTARFSDRVEDYVKTRPGYPRALMDYLRDEVGLASGWTVADVGSGTGIFTALLLDAGCQVYAVEPNGAMRMAAERLLAGRPGFKSVCGLAEETGLPSGSVDFVVAAQAFHWFDAARTRGEFKRILKSGGQVALVWNDRRTDASPILCAYEELLRGLGVDYAAVNHRNVGAARLAAFFGGGHYRAAVFENEQCFDWKGLLGRAMSSSYVPGPGHPGHAAFTARLRQIYERYSENGHVVFEYDTRLYHGALM